MFIFSFAKYNRTRNLGDARQIVAHDIRNFQLQLHFKTIISIIVFNEKLKCKLW